jgi:hypothetical protein
MHWMAILTRSSELAVLVTLVGSQLDGLCAGTVGAPVCIADTADSVECQRASVDDSSIAILQVVMNIYEQTSRAVRVDIRWS